MTRFTVGFMFVAAALSAPACGHSDAATAAADGEAIQTKTLEGPVSLDPKMLAAIRIEAVVEREIASSSSLMSAAIASNKGVLR